MMQVVAHGLGQAGLQLEQAVPERGCIVGIQEKLRNQDQGCFAPVFLAPDVVRAGLRSRELSPTAHVALTDVPHG